MKYDTILTEENWKKSMGVLSMFTPERTHVGDMLRMLKRRFDEIDWSILTVKTSYSDLNTLKKARDVAKKELEKLKYAQTQALAVEKYANDVATKLKNSKVNPRPAAAASHVGKAAGDFVVQLRKQEIEVPRSFDQTFEKMDKALEGIAAQFHTRCKSEHDNLKRKMIDCSKPGTVDKQVLAFNKALETSPNLREFLGAKWKAYMVSPFLKALSSKPDDIKKKVAEMEKKLTEIQKLVGS